MWRRNDTVAKQCARIRRDHSKVARALMADIGRRRLRAAFLVSESSKWSCQSLYEEMERASPFEPIILVTADYEGRSLDERTAEKVARTLDFFQGRGMRSAPAYDMANRAHLDLRRFKPDLVFYQQPWYLHSSQSPPSVSRYALDCYVPYSIAGTSKAVQEYPATFLYGLWRHFLLSDLLKREYESWMTENKESLVVTGHPKLDAYRERAQNDQHYIIYAPHFSLKGSLLRLSTFDWSGRFLLDYARSHRQLHWLFKPHPDLRATLVSSGEMTEVQAKEYYEGWSQVGTVHEEGDYFGAFQRSDALITDSSSFLSEYLPTGNPVIHMLPEDMTPQNPVSRISSAHYYKAQDVRQLESFLDDVIVRGHDPLREERLRDVAVLNLGEVPASRRIINYIEGGLRAGGWE
ncbi:MAG: CDP-glycerol glycerophosphotransferase family protein [Methanomassiliicoccales archaeon]|nr:CDP-glycerol glycerophosphotransferase family protein [Methanomassiliicoccales archaeon]